MPTYLVSFLKKSIQQKMTITISPEHGYVILAASGTFLLNVWQMKKIGGKRKELGIAVSLEGISSTYYNKTWNGEKSFYQS